MRIKLRWKVWVYILTVISAFLLMLVGKLIYDKSNVDKFKLESQKYLTNIENELEVKYTEQNNLKWILMRNQTIPESLRKQKFLEYATNYANELRHIQGYIQQTIPWKLFKNSSTAGRKLKVIYQVLNQNYHLSEFKYSKLTEIREEISHLRKTTFLVSQRNNESISISKTLPHFIQYCKKNDFRGPKTWMSYFELIDNKIFNQFYLNYVNLVVEAGAINQFSSPNEYFISSEYEVNLSMIDSILKRIWNNLKPFYEEFHAHLRGELRLYFPKVLESNGTIPLYFLSPPFEGNTDSCSLVYELTKPYAGTQDLNLGNELKRMKYTTIALASAADNYLGSIGLPFASASFWSEFILSNSSDEGVPPDACNISELFPVSIDANQKEFRIKFCSSKSESKNFASINKIMIKRSLQFIVTTNQPFLLQKPVTPALISALENSIYMSMNKQFYLQKLRLLENEIDSMDIPSTLNKLYKEVFSIFPKLIRTLVYHHWFNEIYHKKIKPLDYNLKWRLIKRSIEGTDFEERQKFGPGDDENLLFTPAENLRELFTIILSYEFYNRYCQNVSTVPTSQHEFGSIKYYKFSMCDLSGNSDVGEFVKSILKYGSSKPWYEILKTVGFNIELLDGSGFMEYFSPLYQHLKDLNRRRELPIGW